MLIKRMDEKNIMLAVSREELYNISEVFSTYITVGKVESTSVRSKDDWAVTYVLDSDFLYRKIVGRSNSKVNYSHDSFLTTQHLISITT